MHIRCLIAVAVASLIHAADPVEIWPLPSGGVQPRAAVGSDGTVHVAWLQGPAEASEVWYATRSSKAPGWERSGRVDQGPGSGMALGMIRGVQIALGAANRPHLSWTGSALATPRASDGGTPVLYSRGTARGFTPPIELSGKAAGIDGGGAIAADGKGGVWVFWHASAGARQDAERAGFFRFSGDDGASFGAEHRALTWEAGACSCCQMAAVWNGGGEALALIRIAEGNTARDQVLAWCSATVSVATGSRLSAWKTPVCPMSTASAVRVGNRQWVAWETEGQVSWSRIEGEVVGPRIDAPGAATQRKHPSLAVDAQGRVCLAWVEGSGWNRAGVLRWQLWNTEGKALGAIGDGGRLPVWGLGAVVARQGGGFAIIR